MMGAAAEWEKSTKLLLDSGNSGCGGRWRVPGASTSENGQGGGLQASEDGGGRVTTTIGARLKTVEAGGRQTVLPPDAGWGVPERRRF